VTERASGGTGFILFFGGTGPSAIERRVDAVRLAIATHLVGLAHEAGFSPVIAVTADPAAGAALGRARADLTKPHTQPFHFGRELRDIVSARGLERVCAVGGGAGPLLRMADLRDIRARVESREAIVVSNNYYSADLVAFTPAAALDAIELPSTDNPLPRLLHQQAGLPRDELARSAATQFDVDTPTDATILLRHPSCPAALKAVDAWEAEQGDRITAILRLLVTPEAELCIAGRVGAPVWSFIETQSACRVRVLSEERGMQAAGRDAGAARTILGFLYETDGPVRFFERLSELGEGIVLDSRVLFAHLGLRPTAADRFASDVFADRQITDERVAEFTRAAAESPVPVLLGGHSLVSGGLWALVEAAWEPMAVPTGDG
jgi:hypothetical protein